MKHYRQSQNSYYCGPYSLLSLLSHFDLEMSKSQMIRYFGGSKHINRVGGVSCNDISRVLLERFDIKTDWGFYKTKRGLKSFFKKHVGEPTIISYNTKRPFSPYWISHFSVLESIKYNRINILDPLISTGEIIWGEYITPEEVKIKSPYMVMYYK